MPGDDSEAQRTLSAATPMSPRITVMPEQFLTLTRAAKLPISVPTSLGIAAPPASPIARPSPSGGVSPASTAVPPMGSAFRRSLRMGAIIAVAVLAIGGIAAFVVLRSLPAPSSAPPQTPPISTSEAPPVMPPASVTPPQPTSPVATPEVPGGTAVPTAPPAAPPASVTPADLDSDDDGLTDAEEVLLGTDVLGSDTDGDGYDDRTELLNLYNPIGTSPQRLVDAGIVEAYAHPTEGWEIYVPISWSVAATDQEQREVEIATGAPGEVMRLRIIPAPEFRASELDPFTSKRGARGDWYGGDQSEAYFPIPNSGRSVDITHEVAAASDGTRTPRRFPGIFRMIVQSFRVSSSR